MATTRASGALVTVFTRVATIIGDLAFAHTALTGAVAGTDLITVRRLTSILRRGTVATATCPAGLTHTAIALAGSMIGARAQQILITFTTEVLTFAVFARDNLFRVGAL